MSLRIGSLELSTAVTVAPMAGVTDAAFRTVLREQGALLLSTEMISAKGLFYGSRNNALLLKKAEGEYPLAVQLFGADPLIMARMAEKIQEDYDIIDVNMGCPVTKIVKNGEGAALMRTPETAMSILETMCRVVSKPVTVKIRKGWDAAHVNAVEFAKMAEAAGVSAVTVHGRTRDQMYAGRSDRDIIKKVREALSIPVIANGDIFTPEDAAEMLRETGAQGVALARGVRGRPWLVGQTVHYLMNGELLPEPDMNEKKRIILRHAGLLRELVGEHRASLEMRKHLGFYIAGIPDASSLRAEASSISTFQELEYFVLEKLPS